MKDNIIQDSFLKIKQYIAKMPKKTKGILGIGLAAILSIVILVTIVINVQKGNYTSLYSGLSTSEAGSIYKALKDLGADVKFDSDGNITVPKGEYDVWILQLAAQGYPKSALTYDVFSSNAGMTATESEKAQWLLYQLQDRIQATLERMDGVTSATVTITIPETSNYVWETATTEQRASAGVLLSLNPNVEMSGEQVSAIRTLIASSVPKMSPEDVAVVDAQTMLELTPMNGSTGTAVAATDYNLGFELMVQSKIEDNVSRLLAPRYGSSGVVPVAKVTIDYDKMMTEKYDVTPPNPSDNGYTTHSEGNYSVNGSVAAGDVVGESNNADIPTYAYNDPNATDGVTDYSWSTDYDYSYIKTQIEKGNAILKRATISVMVNETSLTETRIKELKSLVSGCTDIPLDLISISAYDKTALNETDPSVSPAPDTNDLPLPDLLNLPMWMYIAAGVGLLVLIIVALIVIAILKRRKKSKLLSAAMADERARAEDARRQSMEIDKYKKNLEDIAKGNIDPKNEAIVEEVRDFAKTKPQVTANLIRTWLKEN